MKWQKSTRFLLRVQYILLSLCVLSFAIIVSIWFPALFEREERTLTVPALTGVIWSEEIEASLQEQFRVTVVRRTDETVAENTVLATQPSAEETRRLRAGCKMPLTVTVGSPTPRVTLPDVRGCSAAAARHQLHALGLCVRCTVDTSFGNAGTVYATDPAPGEELPVGGTVELHVVSQPSIEE